MAKRKVVRPAEEPHEEAPAPSLLDMLSVADPAPVAEAFVQLADDGKFWRVVLNWLDNAEVGQWELRAAVYHLARILQPRVYVEVGVRLGWSLAMAAVASPDSQIIAIDPFVGGYAGTDNPGADEVRANVARVHLGYAQDNLRFVVARSQDVLSSVLDELGEVELITLDGDHTLSGVEGDLRASLSHLCIGGALILDDYGQSEDGHSLPDLWRRIAAEQPDKYAYVENFTALDPLLVIVRVA